MLTMRYWLLGVCLLAGVWAQNVEEDFGFESTPEELPSPATHVTSTPKPVQRRWGVPDSTAYVGKLFHLTIAQDAFSGDIDHYEATGKGGSPLPSWLLFHKASGLFEGVPTSKDVGENYITVRAVGTHSQDWAKDVFSIDVLVSEEHLASAAKPLNIIQHKVTCTPGEESTFFKIVMDVKYEHLKPKQRVAAIKNLSGFLALHYSLFQLVPQSSHSDVLLGESVIMAGPGNVKKLSNRQSSVIKWQVGCSGHLVKPHSSLAIQLKEQAHDGTIAEVVGQPVVGWHVENHSPTRQRERRETGSGDYEDDYDYEEEENLDNEEDVTESVPEQRVVPTMVSPVFPEATVTHPHRHHHGEDKESGGPAPEIMSTALYRLPTSPLLYGTIVSTPTLDPVRPTRLSSSEVLEPSRAYNEYAEISPSATPVFITEVEPSITPEMPTDHSTEALPTLPSGGSSPDVNGTEESFGGGTNHSSTYGSTSSSPSPTSEEPPTTTEKKPTTRHHEETIEEIKNFQPRVENRLPKFSITAGKALRFIIPENTFSDLEDGNTRSLRLVFKTSEGRSVPATSWVQFNPETQEIYALPLEEHVSRWVYVLEAMDGEGATVSENLDLSVQHHKGRRTVNHEFSLYLHIESKFDFPSAVDWQLRVLDRLVRLYEDSDANQITVRNVSFHSDPVIFSWTNDSLPRTNCPVGEINRLLHVLQDRFGEPTSELKDILASELKVKKITHQRLGQCEIPSKPPTGLPDRSTDQNSRPAWRNQVDQIDATVGELLVFRVPEDSCYDEEDKDTRHLKLSLLNMDRSSIAPSHWLQFDVKNQEFYGIPMTKDEGRKEYQLVCEDSAQQKAYDGLLVVVGSGSRVQYNVAFHMKLDIPYETFANSASLKRKFVDKLRDLFGDRNTSAIVLSGIHPGSTIVTWHNQSLSVDDCPDKAIIKLRRVLLRDDESIAEQVRQILGPEFPVLSINLTPLRTCQGQQTLWHNIEGPPGYIPPDEGMHPVDESPNSSDEYLPSSSDEYLLTFVVPAVIIAAMLVLAGVVACFLYRRRRSGKMSPGEDDERQAFRSKGIPVIFQDELEERPDPQNKSPVIMKEEKPPLPPPEYRREETPPPTAAHPLLGEEDPPYQPPPPFSRDPASRQTRPKPTPTYRKPPPYVPP